MKPSRMGSRNRVNRSARPPYLPAPVRYNLLERLAPAWCDIFCSMGNVLVRLAAVALPLTLDGYGYATMAVTERMLEDDSVAIATEVCVLLSQYATTLRR